MIWPEKQHTLGILDSEFNQNNKRIGKDAIDNAFRLKKISQEQFATRGKADIDQIISKRCLIDHNHSTHSSFALTSSDISGCHYRIVHTVAELALLRVGIPHSRIYCVWFYTEDGS